MATVKRTPSEAFLAVSGNGEFNSSEWKPVPGESYTLEETWAKKHPGLYEQIDGDVADIVAVVFDSGDAVLRIEIPFKDGTKIQLKLSGKSELEEGDQVAISSLKGQLLRKIGQEDIVRYDGVKIEESEN